MKNNKTEISDEELQYICEQLYYQDYSIEDFFNGKIKVEGFASDYGRDVYDVKDVYDDNFALDFNKKSLLEVLDLF